MKFHYSEFQDHFLKYIFDPEKPFITEICGVLISTRWLPSTEWEQKTKQIGMEGKRILCLETAAYGDKINHLGIVSGPYYAANIEEASRNHTSVCTQQYNIKNDL